MIKKSVVIILILSALMTVISACDLSKEGLMRSKGEWIYILPNEYRLWAVNTKNVVCGKKESETSISRVGGDDVIQFCYNDKYICLKCTDFSYDICTSTEELDLEYYIIDTETDQIYGPFSESEYENNKQELGQINLSEWTNTKPAPEGIVFED